MNGNRMIAWIAAPVLLLAVACSGDDGDDEPGDGGEPQGAVVTRDESREGPAQDVEGAAAGGTITVYLPGDPGPDSLDPTGGWEGSGRSIQQALTHRSLTQYARGDDGQAVLVPDLAVDLGKPNDDFTEWRFTIREDATWEDGKLITPEEVAFGITRSLDTKTFGSGPGTEYSATYFAGAENYDGPYTSKGKKYGAVSVDGQDVVIKMSRPFPEMDHWGAFMAMGPAPVGKASDPPRYGQNPLSNGPYKVKSFKPHEELVLERNDQWVAQSDPARHQYADAWVFKFNQDQAQVDELMLSAKAESQTAISTSLGSVIYERAESELGERLVQQSSRCVSTLTPDYTKVTEIAVRKALAYAYPYEDVWLAGGEIPGVTRNYASSVMPPGMPGKLDFAPDGKQVVSNPERSKELLAEAGYEPGDYEITMIYHATDPLQADAQEQITRGFEEGGFKVRAIPVEESPYNVWTDPDSKLNKKLNLRGVNLCADWPSGFTIIPALLRSDSPYNTAFFDEPEIDEAMSRISTRPRDEQADAWGELDQRIMTDYFPIIPTAFRNDLFVFGEKIGNPSADGWIGAPNYKDLYVSP